MTAILLEARGLVRTYKDPFMHGLVTAVNGVSFTVEKGHSIGILGASGAGKSSLTRLLLALERPDQGQVLLHGTDITTRPTRRAKEIRRGMQAVFQDPRSSLNPHLSVGTIISEPLLAQGGSNTMARKQRINDVLRMVGLPVSVARRRPEQLSGGEKQRVAIARAIAPGPEVLILDEPVSSLDGPVRSQVLQLLEDLKAQLGLTIVMVSHDVRSIRRLVENVMVMYAGRTVEEGPVATVLNNPLHPYTQALLAAIPHRDMPARPAIDPTNPAHTGCACREWCPMTEGECANRPQLERIEGFHRVACWVSGKKMRPHGH